MLMYIYIYTSFSRDNGFVSYMGISYTGKKRFPYDEEAWIER